MDESNPYEAPRSYELAIGSNAIQGGRWTNWLRYGSGLVVLVNLPVPAYFGWPTTEKSGKIGVFLGVFFLVVVGQWVCSRCGRFGKALLTGGSLMALSQLVPIFPILAGLLGLFVGEIAGQVTDDDMGHYEILGEPGKFLVTVVTGVLLLTGSIVAGIIIQTITPRPWWINTGNQGHMEMGRSLEDDAV